MEKQKESLFGPMDLTRGTCWKTILIFSLPVILSYLLQQVYSISDAAIVGQTLTAQEVAGVNDTSSLVFIFLQFAFGVSAGFCVVTSCQVGARNQAGVRRSLATQIVLSAVLTVLLTALALALLNPMLAWINVTPDNAEVYRAAYTYCFIIFAGIGAQLFYNFICAFLRSMGDSLTPLLFLLFSTVLNVGLDLLFIMVFRWGVAGAAIATVAAQLISTVACFIYAFAKYPQLRDKRIILFAPTFRGNGQMSAYYPADAFHVDEFMEALPADTALLIKYHPFCPERPVIPEGYKDRVLDLSDEDELNDLLFITDLLITDYSSVVFEASLLDIPMLFYAFDLFDYISKRDFYYDFESFVPGKIVFSQRELTEAIVAGDFESEKVPPFKTKFFDHLDGRSSRRVADLILRFIGEEA